MRFNRRELLAMLAARAAAAQEAPVTIPGKRPMIVHSDRPEDLETPLAYFDSWITPNDSFFVRHHLPRTPIDPAAYRLAVDGMVSTPRQLTLADLQKLPQHTVPATIECTGNGRAFFSPKVPGIQWGRGAIGNAEWTGPRISDVLRLAGAGPSALYLEADGVDSGLAATPDFIRSLPMKKAMQPATILALKMNGQPLPEIHGAPARLIVPGWDGTSSVKWVIRLSAASQANNGFYMNPGYRFPRFNLPPGVPARPAELDIIEGMPVKSSITAPEDQSRLKLGAIAIRGFAWAGEEAIERVEVSTDGGSKWQSAGLSKEKLPFAWRLFHLEWRPAKPGYYTILSRATDTAGNVQPIVAPWNPSGYLWNSIDRVGVTVEQA